MMERPISRLVSPYAKYLNYTKEQFKESKFKYRKKAKRDAKGKKKRSAEDLM